MATSKNTNDILFERLAEGLDSTSKLTHALLSEIRESESDFAVIKSELSTLRENVKSLSEIIKEGNGSTSILTKIALFEQRLLSIDKWIDDHSNIHQNNKLEILQIKDHIKDINIKMIQLEKEINSINEKEKEEAKNKKTSMERELELEHEGKKNAIAIKAERQSAIIKLLAAVILAILGGIGTWFISSSKPPELHKTTPAISSTNKF